MYILWWTLNVVRDKKGQLPLLLVNFASIILIFRCSKRPVALVKDIWLTKEQDGIQLLTKCVEHQLVITNSLFHQENRNKTSWRHTRSPYWHMIDYVFEHCCDRKDILKTKKMTSSDECWINHRLVWSSISFVLRKQRKILKQQKFKHNLIKLEPSSSQNLMQHCYMLMTSILNASGKVLRLPLTLYVMKHWAARSGAVRTGLMTMT